jgi:hypothetical protein
MFYSHHGKGHYTLTYTYITHSSGELHSADIRAVVYTEDISILSLHSPSVTLHLGHIVLLVVVVVVVVVVEVVVVGGGGGGVSTEITGTVVITSQSVMLRLADNMLGLNRESSRQRSRMQFLPQRTSACGATGQPLRWRRLYGAPNWLETGTRTHARSREVL